VIQEILLNELKLFTSKISQCLEVVIMQCVNHPRIGDWETCDETLAELVYYRRHAGLLFLVSQSEGLFALAVF
jgi:hypothetical protein